MNNKRINRISEEIRKVISELIRMEIKDPRVDPMTSITKVQVTNDLSFANVYVSVLGNDQVKEDTLDGLKSAKGFIRREIGQRINLRYTPEIILKIDDTIEQGMHIDNILQKLKEKKSNDDE